MHLLLGSVLALAMGTGVPIARARTSWVVAVAVILAAGCGANDGNDDAITVALLLPETKTARYETQDRPLFEARIKELCTDCDILYSNAEQDARQQQSQAEAALTNGADVLVLDPVDSSSAASIVGLAKREQVPVVSYDRLTTDADIDFYVSHDNEKVGELQAIALTSKLQQEGTTRGTIVMINGAPTDNNATLLKQGAHSVLDESAYDIGVEHDTPDWSPDVAQSQMEQSITRLGPNGFVGVYAANDGTAGGAIAAMKAAGISPLPPVTGQDAELAGIQRILAGEQYMTVYKPIEPLAGRAADAALALARGEELPADLVNETTDNGAKEVPSLIIQPVAVTVENIAQTVLANEFWSIDDICTSDYEAACAAAGLR